ncbi:MAG: hypothetical protein ACXWXQ_11995 [Actinomycetota bacterium]
MKTTGRSVALAVAFALALAACTGDGEDGNGEETGGTGPVTGATGTVGPTPVVSGSATEGTYEYVNTGVRVVLRLEGTAGTLEVDNGTGHDLPRPSFYLLGATDGAQFDGDVVAPAPIADGETATFDVTIEGIEIGEIGAIALLFGRDNYGLFVRTG